MANFPESLNGAVEGVTQRLTKLQTSLGIVVARVVRGDMAEWGYSNTRYIRLTTLSLDAASMVAGEQHNYEWLEKPDGRQSSSVCRWHCWSYTIGREETVVLSPSGAVLSRCGTDQVFSPTGEGLTHDASLARRQIQELVQGLLGAEPHEDVFNPANVEAYGHVLDVLDHNHTILNPAAKIALDGLVQGYRG